MIVIIGLAVLVIAVIVGFTGVLTNTGQSHLLPGDFAVFGYHVTGSTGALFLLGILVGAVSMLGLCVLLAGARRTAGRERDARRELARSQRETEFLTRERDQRLEHTDVSAAGSSAVNRYGAASDQHKASLFSRWSHSLRPAHTPERQPAAADRHH